MVEEKFDIVYVDGIEDDFIKAKLKEDIIIKIHTKLSLFSQRIISMSDPVKGTHYKIRKYRIGKYRLFLYLKDFTIYCLAFIHRKECYKRASINRIVTLVREIKK